MKETRSSACTIQNEKCNLQPVDDVTIIVQSYAPFDIGTVTMLSIPSREVAGSNGVAAAVTLLVPCSLQNESTDFFFSISLCQPPLQTHQDPTQWLPTMLRFSSETLLDNISSADSPLSQPSTPKTFCPQSQFRLQKRTTSSFAQTPDAVCKRCTPQLYSRALWTSSRPSEGSAGSRMCPPSTTASSPSQSPYKPLLCGLFDPQNWKICPCSVSRE